MNTLNLDNVCSIFLSPFDRFFFFLIQATNWLSHHKVYLLELTEENKLLCRVLSSDFSCLSIVLFFYQ